MSSLLRFGDMLPNRRRGFAASILALLLLASACTLLATPTPTPAPVPADAPDPDAEAWRETAAQHRGSNGEQFEYDCPAGGPIGAVWGTDVYTDDSSVCTAGVHAGAITVAEGGTVTIEIRPGEDSYDASQRNGIEAFAYGQWSGSFVVVTD